MEGQILFNNEKLTKRIKKRVGYVLQGEPLLNLSFLLCTEKAAETDLLGGAQWCTNVFALSESCSLIRTLVTARAQNKLQDHVVRDLHNKDFLEIWPRSAFVAL